MTFFYVAKLAICSLLKNIFGLTSFSTVVLSSKTSLTLYFSLILRAKLEMTSHSFHAVIFINTVVMATEGINF